tara:strand:- start:22019 stop:22156 length:138 start_codon:yes stop_codon:yes gene_type:complete
MNKILLGFLISLISIFLFLIIYIGTTEVIISPKVIEKELNIDYEI